MLQDNQKNQQFNLLVVLPNLIQETVEWEEVVAEL